MGRVWAVFMFTITSLWIRDLNEGALSGVHLLSSLTILSLIVDGREIFEESQEDTNLVHLLCTLQFGTLPHGLTVKNLEMFATEVGAHFRPVRSLCLHVIDHAVTVTVDKGKF